MAEHREAPAALREDQGRQGALPASSCAGVQGKANVTHGQVARRCHCRLRGSVYLRLHLFRRAALAAPTTGPCSALVSAKTPD